MVDLKYVIQVNKELGGTILSRNSLESAFSSWEYYGDIESQIASIVRGLVKNHAFTDGNKRTAFLIFLVLCEENAIPITKDSTYFIALFLNLAETKYSVEKVRDLLFG